MPLKKPKSPSKKIKPSNAASRRAATTKEVLKKTNKKKAPKYGTK